MNAGAPSGLCVCDGLCEWNACPGVFTPPTINNSLHPSVADEVTASNELRPSSEQPSSKRLQFTDEKEMGELAKGIIPITTSRATKWALKTFEQWSTARNSQQQLDRVPTDLLTSTDPEVLNIYLSLFAVEARKTNGANYPPATLHQLLCGILRHMRANNSECPNFLDKKDGKFKKLQSTLCTFP